MQHNVHSIFMLASPLWSFLETRLQVQLVFLTDLFDCFHWLISLTDFWQVFFDYACVGSKSKALRYAADFADMRFCADFVQILRAFWSFFWPHAVRFSWYTIFYRNQKPLAVPFFIYLTKFQNETLWELRYSLTAFTSARRLFFAESSRKSQVAIKICHFWNVRVVARAKIKMFDCHSQSVSKLWPLPISYVLVQLKLDSVCHLSFKNLVKHKTAWSFIVIL